MAPSVILILTLINGGAAIQTVGFYDKLGTNTLMTCEAAGKAWVKDNNGLGRGVTYMCVEVK